MELPVSINTLGGIITLACGIAGLFWPLAVANLVSIEPVEERGISEIRATYGGLFFAMGLFALIAQTSDVFRLVGVAWLGAASARSFSYVRDNSRSGMNLGAIVMETSVGLTMLVPWNTFTGA